MFYISIEITLKFGLYDANNEKSALVQVMVQGWMGDNHYQKQLWCQYTYTCIYHQASMS